MASFLKILVIVSGVLVASAPGQGRDAVKGRAVFKSECSTCHASAPNSPPGIGPRLFGVVGRTSGTLPGYSYSAAMKNASVPWGPTTLKTYIANPQNTIPGIKMPYGGLHDPAKLDDLLAFLETLK